MNNNENENIIIKSKDGFEELVISPVPTAEATSAFVNYTLIGKSAWGQEDLSAGRLYADGTMYVEWFEYLSCNTGDADISVLFKYLSHELNSSAVLYYLHGIEWIGFNQFAEEDDVTAMEDILISHFPDTGKDEHNAQYCAVLEQCIKNQDFMSRLVSGKDAFEPFAREIAHVRAMKMQDLEGVRKRIAN